MGLEKSLRPLPLPERHGATQATSRWARHARVASSVEQPGVKERERLGKEGERGGAAEEEERRRRGGEVAEKETVGEERLGGGAVAGREMIGGRGARENAAKAVLGKGGVAKEPSRQERVSGVFRPYLEGKRKEEEKERDRAQMRRTVGRGENAEG